MAICSEIKRVRLSDHLSLPALSPRLIPSLLIGVGNESTAVVEFAPYQKIPTEKKKTDARSGTIEKDEDYLSFLESLNNKGSVPGESGESASLESLSEYSSYFFTCLC